MRRTKFFKKEDFKVGDFILYFYVDGEYLKGEIKELHDDYAVAAILIPSKKAKEFDTEDFEVDYSEIAPFSQIFEVFDKL